MADSLYVPAAVKRAIVREMADWLEGRNFALRVLDETDMDAVILASRCWAEGYRRAIHELRCAAAEPVSIPDDISEIE